MTRSIGALIACAGLACSASLGFADVAVPAGDNAKQNLANAFPGVRTYEGVGRVLAVYGVGMTQAARDGEAVAQFLAQHDQIFGAGPLDLEIARVNTLEGRPKTVYTFRQKMDGLPVELSRVAVVTHNEQDALGNPQSTVVFASAKIAPRPEGGFAPDAFTAEDAIKKVQGIQRFSNLLNWSEPEMVVYFGEGDFAQWIDAVRTWKFTAMNYSMGEPQKFTFFVNAATNELVFARNDIHNIDITGTVKGWVSINNTADWSGNPPALLNMSEVLVRVQGQPATTVKANRNGQFTIPWAGNTPVTLEVSTNTAPFGANAVTTGQVRVTETGGAIDTYTQVVTPGVATDIIMNPATGRTEQTTAEVNALYYVTQTRNYFSDLAPSFAVDLDTIGGSTTPAILPANTQVAGTCNAFYDGVSTNYYPIGGGCNNTAFASVINHEYGHHIVNRLGLAQGAFGEGFADTMSILINDDPVIGRYFSTTGGVVRLPDTAGITYPCSSTAIHTCGQIIGDFIIELRRDMGTRLGSGPGLTAARVLHADWAQITGGGIGLDSAHPQTVIEFLTADDNDSSYCNGTPNSQSIFTAAAIKAIPTSPTESRLTMTPSPTNPTAVNIKQDVTVRVDVLSAGATFTPGSARLAFRHAPTNSFYTVTMQQVGANTYQGTIPAGMCGERLDYRFIFGSSQGDVTLPNPCQLASNSDNPSSYYTTNVGVAPFYSNTFEGANDGWAASSTATTGQWVQGDPIGTLAQPEAGSNGVNCWFTGQGTVGGALGDADVDGGTVTLTSPAFNLSSRGTGVVVNYDRWYSNGTGGAPFSDIFRVEFSGNNGSTWIPAETVGPASSADTNPGWRSAQVAINPLGLSGSSQFRVRFIAEDAGTGSLVEAAMDNFRLSTLADCGCNDIDFNNDSSVFDPADIDDFLSVYSEGPCSTGNCDSIDFNNNGSIFDPQDIDSFLSVYSEGPCIQ
ncbi:MAG: hypothetical protein U0640_02860 [Phycisphaerales bacterium]